MRFNFCFFILIMLFSSCENPSTGKKKATKEPVEEIVENDTIQLTDTGSVAIQVDISPVVECLERLDGSGDGIPGCLNNHIDLLQNISEEQADSIFGMAYAKLNSLMDRIPVDLDHHSVYDENWNIKPEAEEPFKKLGYQLDSEEGTLFLKIDPEMFKTYLDGRLSDGTQAYLDFLSDHRLKIAYDAGLILSPKEYADRMIEMERILLNYKSFTGREELMHRFLLELPWFLFGLDNTPAFDWESKAPHAKWSEAWKYAARNGRSVIEKVMTKFLADIEENGGQQPEGNPWEYINKDDVRDQLNHSQ